MEGKSGINFVLMIVAILFVVLGFVFCVLFGINQPIPGRTYDIEVNLYIGLAAIGLGIIMLIGCNIATNARITADNTYDALRHIELLCKREGISMADLARKDAKAAKKEAEILEKEQTKAFEAKAQALAQAQAQVLAQAQAQALAQVQAQQAAAVTVRGAQESEADQTEVDEQPAPQEEKVPNCGIEYAEWKSKMEPVTITCATCGGEMSVRNTKKGIVVLACKSVADGKCKSTPLPIESMAQQFVEWYNKKFGEDIKSFDMDAFIGSVDSIEVEDGIVTFQAK